MSINSDKNIFEKLPFTAYLIVAALAGLLYMQTLSFGLAWCDDFEIILKNFDRIENIDRLGDEFMHGYMTTNYYRPIINLSFLMDAQLGGQEPFHYHLTNLIIHILSSCIFLLLLRKLGIRALPALGISLIFAAHPILANAVAWIVGRNDMLMALFAMASFFFYLKYRENNNVLNLILHIFLFLLSVLSKETAVVFPLVILSYNRLIANDKFFGPDNIKIYVGWVLTGVIWFVLRSSAELGEPVYSSPLYFFSNLQTIPELISKIFIPYNFSVLPVYDILPTSIGTLLILLLVILIIKEKQKRNYILFGISWFLIMILPGLFIRTADAHDWNEYLECRAYLPFVGILISLLFLIPGKLRNGKNFFIASIVIAIGLSALTFFESKNYENSFEFYRSAVDDNPDRAKFHFMLHKLYLNKNDETMAEKELLETVRANPEYAKYQYNVGVFYFKQQNFDKAKKYLDETLRLDSSYSSAYDPLARVYYTSGDLDKAISVWKYAVERWDSLGNANLNLLQALLNKGNMEDVGHYTELILTKNTSPADAYNMLMPYADYYYSNQDYDKALGLWGLAIELNPSEKQPYKNKFIYYYEVAGDLKQAALVYDTLKTLGGRLHPDIERELSGYKSMEK